MERGERQQAELEAARHMEIMGRLADLQRGQLALFMALGLCVWVIVAILKTGVAP